MNIIGDFFSGEGKHRSPEQARREHEDAERAHRDAQRAHDDESREHYDERHEHHDQHKELELLREANRLHEEEIALLKSILAGQSHPKLSSIKVLLSGGNMPVGPLTISVGQSYTATVVGFDQNGAPFTGALPTPTFAIDNSAIATLDPTSGAGVGVSGGTANVSGSLTSAEGLALTDTETLNVTAVVPVLSSIKVSLDAV